mmetsp:Transcript_2305/g.4809  ORF Transcript_2305/g.4809 Transcript_2305/m.4809 type:complete len:171 (-) Transcript_2305:131-643(-)|eukprot:CAMPEP_0178448740 /NCGR_PEP_ID=MMETSP0689_2-20121128/42157_1 /TAXON_ID=160604 /ORGANISM="Amphidinium massartii, Strain CS-259" /LENGTH=170 /DNA_ID=CAMNT_0020073969 /DNA_START=1 /DNA_END=513 /DNA_ORIENTATION=+
MESAALTQVVDDERLPPVEGVRAQKLVAGQSISAGEVIIQAKGEVLSKPTLYSLQWGADAHFSMDGTDARFYSHSSLNPNSIVVGPSRATGSEQLEFRALRDIQSGEDLTFDYNTTEWDMNSPFTDAESGEEVKGFKHLPEKRKQELLEADRIAPHILRLWLLTLKKGGE